MLTFEDLHMDLLMIVSEYGARPDVPIESEEFFTRIIETFPGSKEECLAFIERQCPQWFRCMDKRPNWIQDANWQFSDELPMVFVGQIHFPGSTEWLHDEASFFVFWNPNGKETKIVIQVM